MLQQPPPNGEKQQQSKNPLASSSPCSSSIEETTVIRRAIAHVYGNRQPLHAKLVEMWMDEERERAGKRKARRRWRGDEDEPMSDHPHCVSSQALMRKIAKELLLRLENAAMISTELSSASSTTNSETCPPPRPSSLYPPPFCLLSIAVSFERVQYNTEDAADEVVGSGGGGSIFEEVATAKRLRLMHREHVSLQSNASVRCGEEKSGDDVGECCCCPIVIEDDAESTCQRHHYPPHSAADDDNGGEAIIHCLWGFEPTHVTVGGVEGEGDDTKQLAAKDHCRDKQRRGDLVFDPNSSVALNFTVNDDGEEGETNAPIILDLVTQLPMQQSATTMGKKTKHTIGDIADTEREENEKESLKTKCENLPLCCHHNRYSSFTLSINPPLPPSTLLLGVFNQSLRAVITEKAKSWRHSTRSGESLHRSYHANHAEYDPIFDYYESIWRSFAARPALVPTPIATAPTRPFARTRGASANREEGPQHCCAGEADAKKMVVSHRQKRARETTRQSTTTAAATEDVVVID